MANEVDEIQELEKEQVNMKLEFLRTIWYFVLAILAVWFVGNIADNTYSFCYIPSWSMEPTIMTKDIMLVSHYDTDVIERYDIIVFDAPDDPDTSYTKRVIGLPGDKVVVKNGKVTVNNEEVDDSFVIEMKDTDGDGTYCVPEGCYFVMGDNRDNSFDSRYWENTYVPQESITGKLKMCLFPLSHVKSVIYKQKSE